MTFFLHEKRGNKENIKKDDLEGNNLKESKDSCDVHIFKCDQCKFHCERSSVLKIHKKKHHEEDEHCYWITGRIGTGYQTYIDAIADIENCRELTDEEIISEIELVKTARKSAWMKRNGNLDSCNM